MPLIVVSLISLVVVAGGLLLLVFGLNVATTTEESVRLRDYVSEPMDQERQPAAPALTFRRAELAGSLRTRLIRPWLKQIGRLLGRFTPARMVDDLRRQLTMAGNPLGLGPREFYGLRLLTTLVGIAFAFGIVRNGLNPPAQPPQAARPSAAASSAARPPGLTLPISMPQLAGAGVALYLGLFLPKRLLRGRIQARQTRIRKSLPDALDMLSVCADAGLGFDQALQRVSERWKTPLGLEFGRVVGEMQMGVGRQAAMRNLADRIEVTELSSFVAVIIQSDQLGMSIVQTLRAQAEQMRVERRQRAQEEARKAPLKMLFPMLMFIFPAMLAVVVGPAVPQIVQFFATLRATVGR
jgi:tight adherence protein C